MPRDKFLPKVPDIRSFTLRFPSTGPIILFSVGVTFLLLARHGVALYSHEYPFYADMFRFRESFQVDPLASTFAPQIVSYLFRLTYLIYDIPAIHLVVGVAIRFILVISVWLLSKHITRSYLAATVCVLASFHPFTPFGWGPLSSLPSVPLGTMSSFKEFDDPVYLSFRGPALFLVLTGTFLFLRRNYMASSILLGIGFYSHSINATAFFLTYSLSLVVLTTVSQFLDFRGSTARISIRQGFTDILKFTIPFLIIIFPQAVSSVRLFPGVTAMSFPSYWSFILNNEPDDLSTQWNVWHEPILAAWFAFSVIATIGFLLVNRQSPKNDCPSPMAYRKVLLAFIWIPWVLIASSYVTEIYMSQIPSLLGDILVPTRLHYTSSVSALFTLILASWVLCRLLKSKRVEEIQQRIRSRLGILSIVSPGKALLLLSILAMACGALVLLNNNDRLREIGAYANLSHEKPAFFVNEESNIFGSDSYLPIIPMRSLIGLCEWIQSNTAADAAFFNPPYIKEFRTLCRRQAYLSEKFDGLIAIFHRKFATVYLERFSDLLGPLSYNNLPGPVFEGGQAYQMIRAKYLSLSQPDIEILMQNYPQYGYWVTELYQQLSYPVVYTNDFFVVYKLH